MTFGLMGGNSRNIPWMALAARAAGIVLAVFAVSGVRAADPVLSATVAAVIKQDLAAADSQAGATSRLQAPGLLKQVYSDRHGTPGWVGRSGPRPIALAMVDVVRASRADGLRPRDYHLEALEQLLAVSHASPSMAIRARDLARLELLLSDAFLRLASDEAQGRLNPSTLRPGRPGPDLAAALRSALQKVFAGAPPELVIESFAPRDPGYLGMRAALARYRHLAANGAPPPIPSGPALAEGDRGPRVAALAHRLQSAGDLAPGNTGDVFDAGIAEALRRYQARHGLQADAIAGPVTLATLNQPAAHWVGTLRVNLERRRELPSTLPPTRLMINVASFRATLFTGGKPQLSEKVIVGKSYQETPEIISRISHLVVNPSWQVPESIARQEILPAIHSDPNYFSRHDYQVLQGWGDNEKRIDPKSIDWKLVSAARLPYHFREPPGPGNPLGRVKFMFTNLHDVYMHDTPARQLFDAAQRTFSHGCIRINHAMSLAAAFLREDGQPDPGLLLIRAASEGSNRRIELKRQIPIYIVYMTAWAKNLNTIEFRPDVYGRDARVLAALDAAPQSPSK